MLQHESDLLQTKSVIESVTAILVTSELENKTKHLFKLMNWEEYLHKIDIYFRKHETYSFSNKLTSVK